METKDEEMKVRDDVDDLCDQVTNLNIDLKLDKDGQLYVNEEKIRSEQDWMEICQKRWPHDWFKFHADHRLANLSWEELYKRVDDANVGLCVRMPSLVGIPPVFRQNLAGLPRLNNLTKMNSVIPLGVTARFAFCLAQEKPNERYWLYFCSVFDMMEFDKISVINLKNIEDNDLVRANPVYQRYNQMLPFDAPPPSAAPSGQEDISVDSGSKQEGCPISHFTIHENTVYLYDQVGDAFFCCDVTKKKAPVVIPRQATKCSSKCMRQIVASRHYMAVVYDHTLPNAGSPEGAYVHARFETPLEEDVKFEVDMQAVIRVMQQEYVCSFVQLYWLGLPAPCCLDVCMPNRERKTQETDDLEMSLADLANAHLTDSTQTLKTKKKEENVIFTFHQIRCVAFHEHSEDALFISVDDGAVFRIPIADPSELSQTIDQADALSFLNASISSGTLRKVDMGPSEEQDLQMFDHIKVSYKTSGRQPARWLHVGGLDSLDNCMLLQGCESMLSGFMFGAFSDEDKQVPNGHKQLAISRDTNPWRCVHACANLFVAHSTKDNNVMIGRLTDFGPAQRMGDIQTLTQSPVVDSVYQSVRCFADRVILQQPSGSLVVAFPSDMTLQELKVKALREHNAKQNKMKT